MTRTQPAEIITSPQSTRLRQAVKLLSRSWRKKEGAFLVEGPQAVGEALTAMVEKQAPVPVLTELFVNTEALEDRRELLVLAESARVRVRQVDPAVFGELSSTVESQGVVAVARTFDHVLTDVLTTDSRFVVVLNQVRDPGNLGTVVRLADAAGADAVVVTSSSVDVYNPKAVRATTGSLFHLPVVTGVGLSEVTELGRARGLQVLAADTHPPVHDLHNPWDTGLDLSRNTLWVFGNEAHGLNEEERATTDAAVSIPMYGRAESLNLATAAGICLFESARAIHLG